MVKDAAKVTPEELGKTLKTVYKFKDAEIDEEISKLKAGYILGYNGKHFVLNEDCAQPKEESSQTEKKTKRGDDRKGCSQPSKVKKSKKKGEEK